MRKLARKMKDANYDILTEGAFSTPFKNKRVRFETVQEILDYLGYEIEIKEKQK